MNRVSSSKLLLAAAGATFLAAAAHSATTAGAPPPAPPKDEWHGRNLQVLAPNMPREQVIGVMKKFSQALGVPCTYCHVEEGEKMNFVADVKREKEMARWMMRVTLELNRKFEVDMNKPEVTCYTCHRGSPHPATAPDEAPKAS